MPPSPAMSVSVVVPVFRAVNTIDELYSRIMSVLTGCCKEVELILVEDCGGDGTWDVIARIVEADSRVRGMRLSRNFGQHNALLCGIRAARCAVIVTLDDDLQNPPEEIPRLLAKLREGFDVVYGTPTDEAHGMLRDMASRITKMALQGAMGAETAKKVSAFRAFRSEVRNGFAEYRSPMVNIDVLLAWSTTRFAAVQVRQDKRAAGESGYTMRKLIRHALNMLTGFSTLPLQIASVAGFGFALIGFCVLLYVLVNYLVREGSVPGFTFLAATIAIFAGIQLFALGIIGEYLARMHFRTMDRPPFVISETLDTAMPARVTTDIEPTDRSQTK
jgi:glycosyltransferase involved in cell wall biosynthesis